MNGNDQKTNEQALREKGILESFCPVPFCTLILNPDGKVGVCREKGSDHSVGDIRNQTLAEIWNGEALKKWRQEFLEGKIVTCSKEQAHKSCHRFQPNREAIAHIELDTAPPLSAIRRLSPDFNGKCNLGCGICDVRLKPNGLYDELGLWPRLEANVFPNLRELDLLGGEPFIQKDLYRLIKIMSRVNPECRWRFTTNGHWRLNEMIRSHLDLIRIRYISVSVDSLVPQVYARIRKGDLGRVLRNIDELARYREARVRRDGEDFQLIFNCTIHRDNWRELAALVSYPLERGLLPSPQLLYRPEKFSILTTTEKERMEMITHYLSNLTARELPFAHWIIRALAGTLPEAVQKKVLHAYRMVLTPPGGYFG